MNPAAAGVSDDCSAARYVCCTILDRQRDVVRQARHARRGESGVRTAIAGPISGMKRIDVSRP